MTLQERKLMDHLVHELQGKHNTLKTDLSRKFKHLTENDLRLCVMLKANISTKEISTLLNITPDSVKKAKHRLRKKLKISPEVQWKDFFTEFEIVRLMQH